ncbi:hypothetical protein ACJX0J_013819 [Zea mays]
MARAVTCTQYYIFSIEQVTIFSKWVSFLFNILEILNFLHFDQAKPLWKREHFSTLYFTHIHILCMYRDVYEKKGRYSYSQIKKMEEFTHHHLETAVQYSYPQIKKKKGRVYSSLETAVQYKTMGLTSVSSKSMGQPGLSLVYRKHLDILINQIKLLTVLSAWSIFTSHYIITLIMSNIFLSTDD